MDNTEFLEHYNNPDNKRIIWKVLSKFRSSIHNEELTGCGMRGLFHCLRGHKPGKGQKFTTSLYRAVTWECQRLLHKPHEQLYEVADHRINLQDYLSFLPMPYQRLLNYYFIHNLTLKELSKVYSCSIETIRKKLLHVIKRVRELNE